MKKKMTALISLALVGVLAISAFAADTKPSMPITASLANAGHYSIQINDQDSKMDVIQMKGTDGKTCIMVPLRAIAEALAFNVTWNNGAVLVDDNTMHTVITLGEDTFFVATSVEGMEGASAPFSLGVAPFVTNGVTYVPLPLFDALLGSKEGTIAVDGNKIIIKTEENVQIPNPFADCKTLDEAREISGFAMTVPDTIDGYAERVICAVKNDLVEVIYQSGDDEIRIRKASGSEDISGDYNAYAEKNTVTVGGLQVTMKGADGKVSVATWTNSSYTFSISVSRGMTSDSVAKLIQAVQ